jgi:hypothetical protein
MRGSGSSRLSEIATRSEIVRFPGDGAEGIRTPDLRDAIAPLSQLSYGPVHAKSSGELVLLGPVDAAPLVVTRRREPKRYRRPTLNPLDRHEVAAVEIH